MQKNPGAEARGFLSFPGRENAKSQPWGLALNATTENLV
jgi:hypothetical protein